MHVGNSKRMENFLLEEVKIELEGKEANTRYCVSIYLKNWLMEVVVRFVLQGFRGQEKSCESYTEALFFFF
jgi:hypothetical protein